MNDLISRKAAIDAIRASTSKYTGFMEMEMYTDDDAVEAIEGLPSAQPEQKWIPVSERLPDVAQRVLLSGHGFVMVGMLHSFGKYSLEPTGISYVYPQDEIDAWMPLPEPYAERREK